jgi:hypothetical protein
MEGDIPQPPALSSPAGWNQVAEDWETIIDFAPDCSFALDCGGNGWHRQAL